MFPPIKRKRITNKITDLNLLKFENQELIVWWYGGLIKNQRAHTVPLVIVFFRKIESSGQLGDFKHISIALTHLSKFRIGTIWLNGICKHEAIFDEQKFNLDFSQNNWKIISPWDETFRGKENPISTKDYPLQYPSDKNYLIRFNIDSNRELLIPCLEYYTSCYGSSSHVKRALATLPWDQACNELYSPITEFCPNNTWPIKLGKRANNSDTVFLAHVLYDQHTTKAAKYIYSQIESSFNKADKITFLRVGPWYLGPAQLQVRGKWINGGRTFLCLQITGYSDPLGMPISRDRANTNLVVEPADDKEGNTAWEGAPKKSLNLFPEIVTLTSDSEPDQGSPTVEIDGPEIIKLGQPRKVFNIRRPKAKSSSGKPGESEKPGSYSTGTPYGTQKHTGQATINPKITIESQGILKDILAALKYLKEKHEGFIQSIECFTFEDHFESPGDTISGVGLQPYTENEIRKHSITSETQTWLYFNKRNKIPRCVLIIRIRIQDTYIYFVEIQRRVITSKDGINNMKEESLKGYIFKLNDNNQLIPWLRFLLSKIRDVKGIVQNLVKYCHGEANTYKHTPSKTESIPCEAAVTNALKKVGIELPFLN